MVVKLEDLHAEPACCESLYLQACREELWRRGRNDKLLIAILISADLAMHLTHFPANF